MRASRCEVTAHAGRSTTDSKENTMKRFRALSFAALATVTTALVGGEVAAAFGDPEIGMDVLDTLCESKGGTAYFSPYAISRCQNARAKAGVDVERRICEGLLGGTFVSA